MNSLSHYVSNDDNVRAAAHGVAVFVLRGTR